MNRYFVSKKTLIACILVCSTLVLLNACNYPGLHKEPSLVPAKALQQTLQAQLANNITPTITPPFQSTTPEIQPSDIPAGEALLPPGSNENLRNSIGADGFYHYITQPGDTLPAISAHFKLETWQISSPEEISNQGYLPAGQLLFIPPGDFAPPDTAQIFPDAEVVNSPTALGFNSTRFIKEANGFLNTYQEQVNGQMMTGAHIIDRVAKESSVNPRLLLAFLEYRSGWVFGQPKDPQDLDYPLGFRVPDQRGLYQELVMAATHINIGYYGWRTGEFNSFRYADGSTSAINPWLNPGSVGVQNLFAKFYKPVGWQNALYGTENFNIFYAHYFGDPWERAAQIGPLIPADLTQPQLELPFLPGERWSLTGGPHASWNTGSPRGAIDFAPVTGEPACSVSQAWATASAPGIIIRSDNNVVAIDLDGDGSEQTGWVIIYLHMADSERVPLGQQVHTDSRIGHPSCDRGQSTGTHVHIARKFNGEWLEADGPVPFHLSGWQVRAGQKNYQGFLFKGDQKVTANPGGPSSSIIVR